MGWRVMMGVNEKQHPKPYPQYPYNPQNPSGDANSTDSTDITQGTGEAKQPNTSQFNSKALGRVVEIVVDPRHPDNITFDGVPYTKEEMQRLKHLDRESLIAAHNAKRVFEGEVQ